jgi:hypothetical protein
LFFTSFPTSLPFHFITTHLPGSASWHPPISLPIHRAHLWQKKKNTQLKIPTASWVLVAHTCNPTYLGGWDQEHCSWRPAQADSWWDPVHKITRAKWTTGVAQTVECLPNKYKALSSNPNPTKKNFLKDINYIFHDVKEIL